MIALALFSEFHFFIPYLISWDCAAEIARNVLRFSEQLPFIFQNTVSSGKDSLTFAFCTPAPAGLGAWFIASCSEQDTSLPALWLSVYLPDFPIRGRKCVLSSVLPGHNTMPTCTSPSINAIWVSDELARASLWETLVRMWRRREVWVCMNRVAYRLLHSLELAQK